MEAEQRIQALEQEVQILKSQIQSILLDIQSHLLTNTYPALRGRNTAGGASDEEEEDDDEYDRASRPAKVKKASKSTGGKRQKAKAPEAAQPAEPVLASLDEQQEWVLQNIQTLGIEGTRELIESSTRKHKFSPEVTDTLMRFTDMYAAAAEEQTLPSRPAGMPTAPVVVKAVTTPPAKPTAKPKPQPPVAPAPVKQMPQGVKTMMAEQPGEAKEYVNITDVEEENGNSSLVLRLIAGVQNAGAGVRWGKKE